MRVPLSVLLVVAVTLASLPSSAEEDLSPLRDYNRLTKEMKGVPRDERAAETKRRAVEYLDAWTATGRTATGSARYALAQFQQDAERYKDSVEGYRAVRMDETAKQKTRDFAATAEANLLTFDSLRDEIGMEAIDKATMDLAAYAGQMTEPDRQKSRGKLMGVLAILHTRAGRDKASRDLRMQIISESTSALRTHVRPIMRGLLSTTHDKRAYDAVRKEAAEVHNRITEIQSGVFLAAEKQLEAARTKLLGEKPDALDDEGNLVETDRQKMSRTERTYSSAKRSYDSASELLKSLPAHLEPFALLGKPAPAWTLEKAYSDEVKTLEPLKGKVVLLDFWNTWGPKCSFPVVRDLLRDYGEKGLAVVGVTASSNMVFVSRFDYDEDHRSKASGGKRYAAKLASEREPANGEYILEEGPYRLREIEAIGEFIENHQLTWPNVLIDKEEPASKFAQITWPHTVILDKQGNIRYLLDGALERGDAVVVARVKKVIEDLLAE